MFREIMNAVINEQNTGLVRRDIAAHWACRCTVPGPGMHQAAALLVQRYRESGLQAENLEYPADATTRNLNSGPTGLEWVPGDSSLEIVAPAAAAGTICRYGDEPLSLVCYSAATPPGGVEAEVVVRSGALGPEQVAEGEFAGKLLLTDQPPSSVEAAADKGGALGIISDCVCPPWLASHPPIREPEDDPELVMWTIFGPTREDRRVFGFNLSGRQGRRLRQLLAESPEPVRLRATVSAETKVGISDLVNACLPGTDLAHEEIWVLAHLSEPGARDNASGCCLAVEMGRILTRLTATGVLPPLRRTLRFLHATEVSGFLPYLAARQGDLPQVVAGLCLDSAGQNFAVSGGEVVLWQSPEVNASFVDGLMEMLIVAAAAEPVGRFTKDNYEIFPWHTEPFWGNDAFVSDGFFDIPTPHLGCWPDRHYHSSHDTPDQMSDNTLGRMSAIDTTFLYLLATAGAAEARWLGHLAANDWKRRLAQVSADGLTAGDARLPAQLLHLGLQAADAATQSGRFAPQDEALQAELTTIAGEVLAVAVLAAAQAARALGVPAPELPAIPEEASAGRVYRRDRWHLPTAATLSPQAQARLADLQEETGTDPGRIWSWVNGRRTAGEIWQRLQYAGPMPLAAVAKYLQLMADECLLTQVG